MYMWQPPEIGVGVEGVPSDSDFSWLWSLVGPLRLIGKMSPRAQRNRRPAACPTQLGARAQWPSSPARRRSFRNCRRHPPELLLPARHSTARPSLPSLQSLLLAGRCRQLLRVLSGLNQTFSQLMKMQSLS